MKIAVYDPFRYSIFSKGISYLKSQGHEVCGFSKHLRTSSGNDFLNLCDKRFSRVNTSEDFYEKVIVYNPDILICTNILDANFSAEAISYLGMSFGASKSDLDNFYIDYKPNTVDSFAGYYKYVPFSSSSIFWLSKDVLVPNREKNNFLNYYPADFTDRYSIAVCNGVPLFYYHNTEGEKDITLSNNKIVDIESLVNDFHIKYFSKSHNHIFYNLLVVKSYSGDFYISKVSFDFFSNFSFMLTLPYIDTVLFNKEHPDPFNFNIKDLESVSISRRESSLSGDLLINGN